jgi:hypothetical protein
MYGNEPNYIKNVDLCDGQLRLTVFDSTEESTTYVFMSAKDAWNLGHNILNHVFRRKE